MASPHRARKVKALLHSPRRTRPRVKGDVAKPSGGKARSTIPDDSATSAPILSQLPNLGLSVKTLPTKITATITGLGSTDHALLSYKERWLRSYKIAVPENIATLDAAIQATLVFAQEEAGTAVCISRRGFLLTCSHCIAETAKDFDREKSYWLLFASGRVVETKCVAWDDKRDLALLQVTSAQTVRPNATGDSLTSTTSLMLSPFPFVSLRSSPPQFNAAMACIGHPGSEDLETDVPGVKTNYDVLNVSTGFFRGCADQDLQDNSEIGALQHDCWTYWGHSGAPLIEQGTGKLAGLHSSWDDESGMRRGISFEALQEFMREQESLLQAS